MASVLSAEHYHDERAAYAWVEARVWPDGPVCPHCGSVDDAAALQGKSTRVGVYKCRGCRKPFTVKVGTIFESSHVPMHVWLQAITLLTSSKKGFSSNQLHRILGVTLKTAWFMGHRIREAMRDGSLAPLGGEGVTVEAGETFLGRRDASPADGRGTHHKRVVVEWGGKARSVHVAGLTKAAVGATVRDNVARESRLMTDEARHYTQVGKEFAGHGRVEHGAGEHVSLADPTLHTNTVEGYFSIFKRGLRGVYQHCGEKHLHRYLAEFDFRYNNRVRLGVDDAARARGRCSGVVGKRLTYRTAGR